MSYQRFAKEISKKFLHNHEQSERLLKLLFQELSRALATPFPITLRGFGTFKRVKLPPRRYYDLNTKTHKTRPAKKTIHFTPSPTLLKKI